MGQERLVEIDGLYHRQENPDSEKGEQEKSFVDRAMGSDLLTLAQFVYAAKLSDVAALSELELFSGHGSDIAVGEMLQDQETVLTLRSEKEQDQVSSSIHVQAKTQKNGSVDNMLLTICESDEQEKRSVLRRIEVANRTITDQKLIVQQGIVMGGMYAHISPDHYTLYRVKQGSLVDESDLSEMAVQGVYSDLLWFDNYDIEGNSHQIKTPQMSQALEQFPPDKSLKLLMHPDIDMLIRATSVDIASTKALTASDLGRQYALLKQQYKGSDETISSEFFRDMSMLIHSLFMMDKTAPHDLIKGLHSTAGSQGMINGAWAEAVFSYAVATRILSEDRGARLFRAHPQDDRWHGIDFSLIYDLYTNPQVAHFDVKSRGKTVKNPDSGTVTILENAHDRTEKIVHEITFPLQRTDEKIRGNYNEQIRILESPPSDHRLSQIVQAIEVIAGPHSMWDHFGNAFRMYEV